MNEPIEYKLFFSGRSIWSNRTFIIREVTLFEFGSMKNKYTKYTVHKSVN